MSQLWISATLLCAAVACGWGALWAWRDRVPAGLSVTDIQHRLAAEREALSHSAPAKPLTAALAREAMRIHRGCSIDLCPRRRAAEEILDAIAARSHEAPTKPLTETQARAEMRKHRGCELDTCPRLNAAYRALAPDQLARGSRRAR
ncbi:hypothetical protein [Nocardia sp. N2S4-5]|uniref:hypothetical protein n=1 Tax=Nocardia sp. N2S4-5 TaxID=3351565 RepID=UPI0037D0BFEE